MACARNSLSCQKIKIMQKAGPENTKTRLPLIQKLIDLGWSENQITFEPEWQVPKTPSEASKREVGKSFKGYPVDVVIFEKEEHRNDWEYVHIIFETKAPDIVSGISQLETYLSLEPRAVAGYWTNGAQTAGLFRMPDGRFKKKENVTLPKPSDNLLLGAEQPLKWSDLEVKDAKELKAVFNRLLNNVVANDTISTRRDDQLNQLSNLLLIKLESDKKAKIKSDEPVKFQVIGSESVTADAIREYFMSIKRSHKELFTGMMDSGINLDDSTIQRVCYFLSTIKLIDTSHDVLSVAFQVFRAASLKSEEGQYFTPLSVIRSAVTLMEIDYEDTIIDPACGTGGFLLECFKQIRENNPLIDESSAKGWAQTHLYGVDKDSINVKLTKAMMMIMGDGSAHIYSGDSIKSHNWPSKYPHLTSAMSPDSYTCILTNPPFGENLKISINDAQLSRLSICNKPIKAKDGTYSFDHTKFEAREIGLVFIERCYKLLAVGGRLGIILPETYFFSASYKWLQYWLDERLVLRGMFNIPMEAFQGFCRAKTNFYIFEKV